MNKSKKMSDFILFEAEETSSEKGNGDSSCDDSYEKSFINDATELSSDHSSDCVIVNKKVSTF